MQTTTDLEAMRELLESIQGQIASLVSQNDTLAKQVSDLSEDLRAQAAESDKVIASLKAELAEAKLKEASLVEEIKFWNMRFYGSKSEKVAPGQISQFNEMEAAFDEEHPEPSIEDALPKRKGKPHRRGGKVNIDYDRFKTIVIEHDIPEGERACPECGCVLREMNVEVTKRLKIVPAQIYVEEHRRHVYRCADCCGANARGEERKSVIVRAPQPKPPIPGSFATPSLISYVINGKYSLGLPLYRMEAEFRSMRAEISRQDMASWVINVHVRWLSKVHSRIKAELLSHDLMHADETTVQVLKEPTRKPRMWLFCSAKRDTPAYVYEYHETRGKSVAEGFLRGWKGTLTTDGYRPYFNLQEADVTNTACLVHVRRKFAEIVKVAGGDAKAAKSLYPSVALDARRMIDEMFKVDKAFDKLDARERKAKRIEELQPLMRDFYAFCVRSAEVATPRSKLDKALRYAIWSWPYVMNVLDDGRLELDNNIAERGMKVFVIGRKAWLFSDTPRGAEASAAIYSIVTTAKMNGLEPRAHIEWLLTEMPNAGELTDEVVDGFLPWSDKVPQECKLKPEVWEKVREMRDEPILNVDPAVFEDEVEYGPAEDEVLTLELPPERTQE